MRALVVLVTLAILGQALSCADLLGFQDLTGSASCGDASSDASVAADGNGSGACGQPGGG